MVGFHTHLQVFSKVIPESHRPSIIRGTSSVSGALLQHPFLQHGESSSRRLLRVPGAFARGEDARSADDEHRRRRRRSDRKRLLVAEPAETWTRNWKRRPTA